MTQLVRYLMVGVANTLVGYAVIFFCMLGLGLSPALSNLLGFCVAVVCSFLLNRRFTFRSDGQMRRELPRFAASTLLAYLLNLATLLVCIDLLQVPPIWAQLVAGAVYTGSSFLISKFWVFKPATGSALPS
jgi:putative flippase GtrA